MTRVCWSLPDHRGSMFQGSTLELGCRKSICRGRVPGKQAIVGPFFAPCSASAKQDFSWTLRPILVLWLLFSKCTTAKLEIMNCYWLKWNEHSQYRYLFVPFYSSSFYHLLLLFELCSLHCVSGLKCAPFLHFFLSVATNHDHTAFSSTRFSNYFSVWSKGKKHFTPVHTKIPLNFNGSRNSH